MHLRDSLLFDEHTYALVLSGLPESSSLQVQSSSRLKNYTGPKESWSECGDPVDGTGQLARVPPADRPQSALIVPKGNTSLF